MGDPRQWVKPVWIKPVWRAGLTSNSGWPRLTTCSQPKVPPARYPLWREVVVQHVLWLATGLVGHEGLRQCMRREFSKRQLGRGPWTPQVRTKRPVTRHLCALHHDSPCHSCHPLVVRFMPSSLIDPPATGCRPTSCTPGCGLLLSICPGQHPTAPD